MKKILTDMAIPQSPKWLESTTYIDDLFSPWLVKFIEQNLNNNKKVKWLLSQYTFLRHMWKYDVIINPPGKGAQLLAFIRALLKIKKPRQIILELMLDEESSSLIWRIKRHLQQFIFSSVDTIFVSSSFEINTYSKRLAIPSNRINFFPMHTCVVKPVMLEHHEGYIFSAGKTGRDFHTLVEAVRGTDTQLVVISDEYHARNLNIPENVKLIINCSHEEYLKWLKNSWFVIIPLKKLLKSTGQIVILEAMGFGKPVIATKTTGTIDYIKNGDNGLLVTADNKIELKETIERLMNDKKLFRQLSENGLKTVKTKHTFEVFVDAILKKANEY